MTPNSSDVYEMAKRHANAWSAHDAEAVAALYENDAVFIINLGDPMNGRSEIAAMVRGYCEEFPDLVLYSDVARQAGNKAVALWTAEGTNSQTGKYVKFGGWEAWTLSPSGLIARSDGWYDAEDYRWLALEAPAKGNRIIRYEPVRLPASRA